ncbi:phage major tail tube protein [Rubrivivax gelatinosus]|uniref:Phage major tail tube protein n=1 Tax=Rubrivivax gelatinosus TaxID=28068 RepID=A0ABS1DNK7_RUBGE|nr:phage major tail tube protein [Rubrivivax gelatinosus]MBK1711296.1 phage major tail tube protein [Rubrivivax gelatinosus]
MALPKKLKNFVLFHAGTSFLGEIPEVVPPKLSRKTEDYRAGGMGGAVKLDQGLEAMEMEWTAAGYLRGVFAQFGVLKHDGVQLRFAGALEAGDSDTVTPVEIVVRGRHTEIDFGTAKAGDNTEIKVKTAISYYRLTLNGEVLIEIDLVNMIENVGGVDRMAAVKSALGV